jgi:2-phosphosulfolactate phosphatase
MIHCEWADRGLDRAGRATAVVVVDVFSFGTAVTLAVERGAAVFPWDGVSAPPENAILCTDRSRTTFSLSPESLLGVARGTRLALPSQNGARLTAAAARVAGAVAVASLRNASAVARWLSQWEGDVAIIPAGERWPDGTLRFAIEDWLGAGAAIAALGGAQSSEAQLAAMTFAASRERLAEILAGSISGRELIARGFANDVTLAAEFDSSAAVPVVDGNGWLAQIAKSSTDGRAG